jgi:DNA-binding NarL/FixJ family response regulator
MRRVLKCGYAAYAVFRDGGEVVERSAVIHDEHPLWLEAVEGVLQRLQVKVAGKATRRNEAFDLVSSVQPDVLVVELDDGIAVNDGLDLVRRCMEVRPGLKVIAISESHDFAIVDAAFAAGVNAYVFKSAHPDDLASAIRQAFEVSIFLAPANAGLTHTLQHKALESSAEIAPGLTKREVEILQLVSEGHSNGELARMLWVTEQTVKFHLSNIYRKLSVANRTEASRWAQVHGLLAQPIAAPAAA